MFGSNGAGAICCQYGTGGNGRNAGTQLARRHTTIRDLPGAREFPFPVTSPFQPVRRARVPATGINEWPGNLLGFTPLGQFPAISAPSVYSVPAAQKPSTLQTIFQGVASILPATISAFKSQPYYNPSVAFQPGATSVPGGVTYAAGGAPYQQPGADIGATAGAAVGGIGDAVGRIIYEHPYLVLLTGAGLVLWLLPSPRRRNPRRRNPGRRRAARRRR